LLIANYNIANYKMHSRRGTTFIDIIISLGIIASLFWGIYLVYFSLIDSVTSIEARTAATEAVNQEIETLRNLPYGIVGTVGGVPAGVIPAQQAISIGNYTFSINTTVRNIDDPFDGVLGGTPNDTAPADYKLVEFSVSCPTCARFVPLTFTTTLAPKNLETSSSTGSIFVNAFNAALNGIAGVTVHVTNSIVSPSIDLIDTTNASGVLQLVGVPTSTLSYHVDVAKSGYSSDRTYPLGGQGNPNPNNKDLTVGTGAVTSISFKIDKVSQLTVRTSDVFCSPMSNKAFSIDGAKTIGTNPDVLKFSTSSTTDANGSLLFPNLEWDTYTLTLSGASYDVLGTIPLNPMIINPNTINDFRFALRSAQADSLLITVTDAATGAVIQGATVNLSKSGYSNTLITGRTVVTDTDWSTGNYTSQNGGIDASSTPGTIKLLANASGTYSTSTVSWLISRTIDVGSSTSNYYSLSWNPTSQPAQTGVGSAKFQLAVNNDNATWNFIGPDGTANTFYTASSTVTGLDNNRYVRYKAFLSTQNSSVTPSIDDVSLELHSVCTPPSQVLFSNLSPATYTIDVTAPQYFEATSSVSVAGAWQEAKIQLTHQ